MKQRITIAEVIENEWFKKGYSPPVFEQANVSLDDVNFIFNGSMVSHSIFWLSWLDSVHLSFGFEPYLYVLCGAQDSDNSVVERHEEGPVAPVTMNAFELISKSQGLNLSSLFEKQMVGVSNIKTEF